MAAIGPLLILAIVVLVWLTVARRRADRRFLGAAVRVLHLPDDPSRVRVDSTSGK